MSRMWIHIRMSHITYMDESWHTFEWVMAHIWMSHATHMNTHTNESCHTYAWVMSHIQEALPRVRVPMTSLTYMNESYRPCEMVTSHIQNKCRVMNLHITTWHVSMSHATRVCARVGCVCVCLCMCVCMLCVCVCECACVHVRVCICTCTVCVCVCARARACVCKCMRASADVCESIDVERKGDTHKIIVGVFWICWLVFLLLLLLLFLHLHLHFLLIVFRRHACVWYAAFTCVIYLIHPLFIWRIHTCEVVHSYDAFTCVTWCIHMPHLHVRRGVFIWRVHMYDVAHPCGALMRHIQVCDMASYSYDSFTCVTWLNSYYTYIRVTLLIRMAYSYVWHDSFIWCIHTCYMTYS